MARVTLLCVLLVTSLGHATSFAVHRRTSRSTDLAEALRMLERQRRRIDNEENFMSVSPQLLGDRPLTLAELEPWVEDGGRENGDEVNAAWLAKTLGLDEYGREQEALDDSLPGTFLQEPVVSPAVEEEPTDEELDAIFGKKVNPDTQPERALAQAEAEAAEVLSKKDKEVLKLSQGDPTVKVTAPRSAEAAAVAATVIAAEAESNNSDDSTDITLTKEEFKTLWKAVEKLQKQAIDKGLAEAEAVEKAVEKDIEKAEKAAEETAVEAAQILTPEPEPVSKEELDNLFEEKTQEVIPTNNGEIVKTDVTVKNAAGEKVAEEETVQQVSTIPDKASLSNIDRFWYMNNMLDPEPDRKKRNSKRTAIPPALAAAEFSKEVAGSSDSAALIESYINKINQLQSELDQAKLVAYLEDVENDILTDALNQATMAQIDGRTSPNELRSLQDAIRVEEALQQVKAKNVETEELAEALEERFGDGVEEKRGEPWRKRGGNDFQSEVPVYLTGDSEEDKDDDEDGGDDLDEDTTALVLGRWMDNNRQQKAELSDIYGDTSDDISRLEDDDNDDDDSIKGFSNNLPALLRQVSNRKSDIASLFSDGADQCPAVKEYSTNCAFADQYGLPIDFEARALCNMHEMCYMCGQSLQVSQDQCDFIYHAASSMLCEEEDECALEAEVFLRAMKLKHRYVDFHQSICTSHCTAAFLGIV